MHRAAISYEYDRKQPVDTAMGELSPRIVLDAHIPGAADVFSSIGRVIALPGHEMDAEAVRNADILIVRSITNVDESLLEGSSVRFVGTATAGIDHLDTEFLSASGIGWASAPGANADSVVEYVLGSIAVIAKRSGAQWQERTLGVVGCGQVGERLALRAEELGMRVLRNDPPRVDIEGAGGFVDLSLLLAESDIVSVHVPFENGGRYPTRHLVDADGVMSMRSGAWLIQSSRGGTVDEQAAVQARQNGQLGALILDVFEGEPTPVPASLTAADLATGHIAGYSRDAKRNGVLMIRDAVCRFLGRTEKGGDDAATVLGQLARPEGIGVDDPAWLDRVLRQVIDLRADDARFGDIVASNEPAEGFHAYRADYPARYAWSRFVAWPDATLEERSKLAALGFRA